MIPIVWKKEKKKAEAKREKVFEWMSRWIRSARGWFQNVREQKRKKHDWTLQTEGKRKANLMQVLE